MFHRCRSTTLLRRAAGFSLLCLTAVGLSISTTGCASAPAPPVSAETVDHRPPRPHPHARWVEGHWTYQQGRYHWVKGSWSR